MERVFQVAAVVLAGVAAYFLWSGHKDNAFVSIVLACVSFFLSVRFQVKERNLLRQSEVLLENDAVDEIQNNVPAAHESQDIDPRSSSKNEPVNS